MALSLFVHLLRVTTTNLTTAGQLDKQTSHRAGLDSCSNCQEFLVLVQGDKRFNLHCNMTIVFMILDV